MIFRDDFKIVPDDLNPTWCGFSCRGLNRAEEVCQFYGEPDEPGLTTSEDETGELRFERCPGCVRAGVAAAEARLVVEQALRANPSPEDLRLFLAKLRSFADSRENDEAMIRAGFSYGETRRFLAEFDRREAAAREARFDHEATRAELVVANRDRHREHDGRVKFSGEAEDLRARLAAAEDTVRQRDEAIERFRSGRKVLAEKSIGHEVDALDKAEELRKVREELEKANARAAREERATLRVLAELDEARAPVRALEAQLVACSVAALGCGVPPGELPPEEQSQAYRDVWALRRMFEARREQIRALPRDDGRIFTIEDLRAALPVGLTVTPGAEVGLPGGAILVTGPGFKMTAPDAARARELLEKIGPAVGGLGLSNPAMIEARKVEEAAAGMAPAAVAEARELALRSGISTVNALGYVANRARALEAVTLAAPPSPAPALELAQKIASSRLDEVIRLRVAARALLARGAVGEVPTSTELEAMAAELRGPAPVDGEDDDEDNDGERCRRAFDGEGVPEPLNLTRDLGTLEEPDR